jgi:hypothetical protein
LVAEALLRGTNPYALIRQFVEEGLSSSGALASSPRLDVPGFRPSEQ